MQNSPYGQVVGSNSIVQYMKILRLLTAAFLLLLSIVPRLMGADLERHGQIINSFSTEWFSNNESKDCSNIVELGSGLNYLNEQGEWSRSRALIIPTESGFCAPYAHHKVYLNKDLNQDEAVQYEVGGVRIKNAPLCIRYYDPQTGKSKVLAQLQNTIGILTSSNIVVYPNAFLEIDASMRYTFFPSEFHADLILHEAPPPPERYGLSSSSRLELLTELSKDSTFPSQCSRVIYKENNPSIRNLFLEPDVIDEILLFSSDAIMASGRAFRMGNNDTSKSDIPVFKKLIETDGRLILIEAVQYLDAVEGLRELPLMQSNAARNTNDACYAVAFPKRRLSNAAINNREYANNAMKHGFVIDYILNPTGSGSSFTFLSKKTYYITSSFYWGGATIYNSDAVIKFANNAYLLVYGNQYFNGSKVNPTVFTSKDDNLYGETIDGSTGIPTQNAYSAIWLYYVNFNVNIRSVLIRYAKTGIKIDTNPGVPVSHSIADSVFQQAQTAISVNANTPTITLNNLIKCGVQTGYSGSYYGNGFVQDCGGDTDSDGLPDSWEMQYFGSLTAQSAMMDSDNDGMANIVEYVYNQNPTVRQRYEPIGPCSRNTGLVISEIMYHPNSGQSFVELYNSDIYTYDLKGYTIRFGNQEYVYNTDVSLNSKAYTCVSFASVPTENRAKLISPTGALLFNIEWNNKFPWPVGADGYGHSMVLRYPSMGEDNPKAWGLSARNGGSPGMPEPTNYDDSQDKYDAININEYIASGTDAVELYNSSNAGCNISGCVLQDDNNNAYTIPAGTIIGARGYLNINTLPFGLSAQNGDSIILWSPNKNKILDAVSFGPQLDGISEGRFPDGSDDWRKLATPTFGSANTSEYQPPVVINEIMFKSPWGDNYNYIELYNNTANNIDISGWKLSGVGFSFSAGVQISAGGYVVVGKDASTLINTYGNVLSAQNCFSWNANSKLSENGEMLELKNSADQTVDCVTYSSGWQGRADGGGSSLELINPQADNNRFQNWAASNEENKGSWVEMSITGNRSFAFNNYSSPNVEIIMLGEGEMLIDDVVVLGSSIDNRVSNGAFSTGMNDWTAESTHDQTFWQSAGGYSDPGCLHVKSTGRGDQVCAKVSGTLSPALGATGNGTLKARFKWLGGTPYFVMRLQYNALELEGDLMDVGTQSMPKYLGTPGTINSRMVVNSPPVVYNVKHWPVLPQANEDVIITARVQDPSVISTITVKWRIDPGQTTYYTASMNDGGDFRYYGDALAKDRIYSARIPRQPAGTMVAFYIEATESGSAGGLGRYPDCAPTEEALIRFGDALPFGNIPTYNIWCTQNNINKWSNRNKQHNTPICCTYVYNGVRVINKSGVMYGGSDYRAQTIDTPTGNLCPYQLAFPEEDRFLGANEASLEYPEQNASIVAESLAYKLAELLGLPSSYSRYVNVSINGVGQTSRNNPFTGAYGTIYEDRMRVDNSYVNTWFSNYSVGYLHKIEVWDEDMGQDFVNPTLEIFAEAGIKKKARYRWGWLNRTKNRSPHDYSQLFTLIDYVNATQNYENNVENNIDIYQWMMELAFQRMVANEDSYGYYTQHNTYIYKPDNDKWKMIPWDLDHVFHVVITGVYNNYDAPIDDYIDGPSCREPSLRKLVTYPKYKRIMARILLKGVNGPMAQTTIEPIIDRYYDALINNGINITINSISDIKQYITNRREYITEYISGIDSVFDITSNNGQSITTTQTTYDLKGTAPIAVVKICLNGVEHPVIWSYLLNTGKPNEWSITLGLALGQNTISVVGFDEAMNQVGSKTITITRQ